MWPWDQAGGWADSGKATTVATFGSARALRAPYAVAFAEEAAAADDADEKAVNDVDKRLHAWPPLLAPC